MGAENVIDQLDPAFGTGITLIYSGILCGQSFTGNGQDLYSATWDLQIWAGVPPTANLLAEIYAHSGVYGTSSLPTGAALATADNVSSAIVSSGVEQRVVFPFSGANRINLGAGVHYVLLLTYSAGDSSNSFGVRADNAGTDHAGNASEFSGGWNAQSYDFIFKVNAAPSPDKSFRTQPLRPAIFRPGLAR